MEIVFKSHHDVVLTSCEQPSQKLLFDPQGVRLNVGINLGEIFLGHFGRSCGLLGTAIESGH